MWIKGKVYLTDTEFTERIVYLKNYMWVRFVCADIDSEEQKLFEELYDALQLALDTWNTRADEPAEKTAHWDINTDGFYPFCSHCGEAAQHMTPHCPNCGAKMITRRHEECN